MKVTHVNRVGERLFVGIPWIIADAEVMKERLRVHLFVGSMITTTEDVWELLLCANDGVSPHLSWNVSRRSSLPTLMVVIFRLNRWEASLLSEESPVASCLTQRSKLIFLSIKILPRIWFRVRGLTGGLLVPSRVCSEVIIRLPHFILNNNFKNLISNTYS